MYSYFFNSELTTEFFFIAILFGVLLSFFIFLLFGSIGYGIYTTVGPSSYKLRDTIKEHARMHELGIAHGHNHHNHNEAEHIH